VSWAFSEQLPIGSDGSTTAGPGVGVTQLPGGIEFAPRNHETFTIITPSSAEQDAI